MSDQIRVTCEKCNHVIKAPRAAAGKRGKCPHCQNSVYVPTPEDELDDIPLAPLDESNDAKMKRLERESLSVANALRKESGEPPKDTRPPRDGAEPPTAPEPSAGDINESIIDYLQAMQSSNLEQADRIVQRVRPVARQAKSRIQQLMVDAMPPHAVRDMPGGLYQGFLRKLLAELEA